MCSSDLNLKSATSDTDLKKIPAVPERQVKAMTQQLTDTTARPAPKIEFDIGDNVRVVEGNKERTQVFSGIVILFFAWLKAGKGYYNKGGVHAYGVSAAVMYWHFVDIVWVFFYPALYLLK